MPKFPRTLSLLAAMAMTVAACGGDGTTTTASPTLPPTTTAAPIATSAPDPGPGAFTPVDGLGVEVAAAWRSVNLGQGTKPVIAIAPDGSPGVAYVLERLVGEIGYLDASSGWEKQVVAEGYFYGPIGLAIDDQGVPHVAYHDHQAQDFHQELGDLTVASLGPGGSTAGCRTPG